MSIEEKINSEKITMDDLLNVSREVHKLPPEDRDWEGRLHLMAHMFRGNPIKGQAIEYRLAAMEKIISSGKLPGWAMPEASDGSTSVSEPVWKATASEPLVFGGPRDEPEFDGASFLAGVLAIATPEGNA